MNTKIAQEINEKNESLSTRLVEQQHIEKLNRSAVMHFGNKAGAHRVGDWNRKQKAATLAIRDILEQMEFNCRSIALLLG
jgi:hypothetical protein